GADIDYGQVVKFYEAEPVGRGRYSPPHVTSAQRIVIAGNPDPAFISTSLIERQNLTMRMSMRRFTRLTNAFSKKVENLRAAVSLHFAHYNFVRVHRTLRVTPAMAAPVACRSPRRSPGPDATSPSSSAARNGSICRHRCCGPCGARGAHRGAEARGNSAPRIVLGRSVERL